MSRQFSKVSPAVWGSKRFVTLPTTEAKLLYLYFLSNEHNNSAGAYRVREGYALADLGWQREVYRQCVANLVEAELVAYDDEAEEVYVLRWFKHNPPQNEKHAQGCKRIIFELDSQRIAELAMLDFEDVEGRRNPLATPQQTPVSSALRSQLAGPAKRAF